MGVVKNWATTYPAAIDVTTVGGSMVAVVDGVDNVMASHPNALAHAVIALETDSINLKASAINAALDGEQLGTSARFLGSLRLPGGVSPRIRVLIGCVDTTKSATLEIRRFTGGATIVTLGGVAGGLTERTTTTVTIPASDWYGLYLYGSDSTAVSLCKGIAIEFPAPFT